MYPYGLVGNCQASALISKQGSVDWLCFPRPDSEPVFGKLLDPEGGNFSISLVSDSEIRSEQSYLENTNILITESTDHDGNSIRITDFFPRFEQHGRMYRPMALFRTVEPLTGSPRIQVACRPVQGWAKTPSQPIRGNSHLRWDFSSDSMRLTTNMSLTYLCEETIFQIKEKKFFALSWSLAIEDDLAKVANNFLLHTEHYWRTWVKHCAIPSQYQKETIRSALALKLHCYEDTGAILAALTTSLPEKLSGTRNWDYRYCWLRDSYFVLSAFHHLGHFEEMEGFLKYFLDIAESKDDLAPVYTLSRDLPLPELEHPAWSGYLGSLPVRTKNQAAEHVQNDVYGEMILTLAPIYLDDRFVHLRNKSHADIMRKLAKRCMDSVGSVDAGLWEVRNHWQEHAFTNLMCWAGLVRIQLVQKRGLLTDIDVQDGIDRAVQSIQRCVVDGSIRNGAQDQSFDASLALAAVLRFPNQDLVKKTVFEIYKTLSIPDGFESFYYRYKRKDDFGKPESAFAICSFWMAQAFDRVGEKQQAVKILKDIQSAGNHLGLFSEHFDPHQKLQLGNFPQAYSHVGMIHAAFSVSPNWSEVL